MIFVKYLGFCCINVLIFGGGNSIFTNGEKVKEVFMKRFLLPLSSLFLVVACGDDSSSALDAWSENLSSSNASLSSEDAPTSSSWSEAIGSSSSSSCHSGLDPESSSSSWIASSSSSSRNDVKSSSSTRNDVSSSSKNVILSSSEGSSSSSSRKSTPEPESSSSSWIASRDPVHPVNPYLIRNHLPHGLLRALRVLAMT